MSQKLITEFKEATSIQFTVSADTTEDQVVVIVATELVGIAHNDIANGETGTVITKGRFSGLAKHSTDTFAIGAKIYWDPIANDGTSTSASNILMGRVPEAIGASDTTFTVDLNF